MRHVRGRSGSRIWAERGVLVGALLIAVAAIAAAAAAPAFAGLGYELDASHPSRTLPGTPRGLTVDQASQDVYVAIVSTNPTVGAFGEIDRFNSDLSADGAFAQGGGYYSGVALNPLTGGFYGAQMEIHTALGNFGTPKLDRFSSAGALTGSSTLGFTDSLPQIVTDSAGRVFFPNVNSHSVQVFNSSGMLVEEITCGGCPGGSFGKPASVALNSAGALYVADAAPDRVVKLTSSGGGPYTFASTVQSGRGAGSVAVDPGTGDVFVGDMPAGKDYHIVAYDSSGTQFDDFGAGLFPDGLDGSGYGSLAAYQMAIDATTHTLYVGELDKFYVFQKVTIDPPAATIKPAKEVGQLTATMSSTVNANGHAVLECEFEYTDEADFQANGYANATALPCPEKPDGSSDTSLAVKVSTLMPATAYRYRVTATSNGGSISSGSATFETLPSMPPTVTTESPQGVGQSAATLEGVVNPHGGSASDCHFEFGTSTSYGASATCSTQPGAVETSVGVERKISGLEPGTAYHYRLVVGTNAGTTNGDDVEFATQAPPQEPEPGPAPASPPPVSPPPAAPVVKPPARQCAKGFRRQTTPRGTRCVKVCRKGFRPRRIHGRFRCVRRGRPERHRRGHGGH